MEKCEPGEGAGIEPRKIEEGVPSKEGRPVRIVAPREAGTCTWCGAAAYSRLAYKCEAHFIGSRPASIEYAVRRAIKTGQLRKVRELACVDCGAQARHYDHRDYNKPLEVDPVCAPCNYARGPAIPYGWDKDGNERA